MNSAEPVPSPPPTPGTPARAGVPSGGAPIRGPSGAATSHYPTRPPIEGAGEQLEREAKALPQKPAPLDQRPKSAELRSFLFPLAGNRRRARPYPHPHRRRPQPRIKARAAYGTPAAIDRRAEGRGPPPAGAGRNACATCAQLRREPKHDFATVTTRPAYRMRPPVQGQRVFDTEVRQWSGHRLCHSCAAQALL